MTTRLDFGHSDHNHVYIPLIKAQRPRVGSPGLASPSYKVPSRNRYNFAHTSSESYTRPSLSSSVSARFIASVPASPNTRLSPAAHSQIVGATPTEDTLLGLIDEFYSDSSETPSREFNLVPLDLYDKIFPILDQDRVRHSYETVSEKLTVFAGPGPVHEQAQTPFATAINDLALQLTKLPGSLSLLNCRTTVQVLSNNGKDWGRKMPDGSWKVMAPDLKLEETKLIVLEVGVSQTTQQLVKVAKDWLLYTEEEVTLVVLVDITKPKRTEDEDNIDLWKGYFEVYCCREQPQHSTDNSDDNDKDNGGEEDNDVEEDTVEEDNDSEEDTVEEDNDSEEDNDREEDNHSKEDNGGDEDGSHEEDDGQGIQLIHGPENFLPPGSAGSTLSSIALSIQLLLTPTQLRQLCIPANTALDLSIDLKALVKHVQLGINLNIILKKRVASLSQAGQKRAIGDVVSQPQATQKRKKGKRNN